MRNASLFTIIVFSVAIMRLNAQVDGLSYEIGGIGAYSIFDEESGLSSGVLLGGEFGFGFGQLLELRGTYMEGFEITRDFSEFDENFDGLEEIDLDFKRYGGELQVNFLKSALKPYLTVGGGVQEIDADILEESSTLYFKGGLGILLTAKKRFAWNIFGNITTFGNNPYSTLLTDAERATYNVDLANYDVDTRINYEIGTKLNFYLGGQDPDKLTELDKALQKSFSSGYRGVTFQFEPTYSWLEFHDDLPYQSTQAIGVKLGADLGPYFGVRAYYQRAMEDGEFGDFVDLSMYGGEFVFNLNEPSGIVPFLSIGGGYLDINDDYVGREGSTAELEDKPYATGAVGLRVPLADVFLLRGSVKSLLMTNEDNIEDVVSTQDVNNSWIYEVGVEFRLGKKEERPQIIEMTEYEKALHELQLQAQHEQNQSLSESEMEIMKLNQRIKELEGQSTEQPTQTMLPPVQKVDTIRKTVETVEQPQASIVIPQMKSGEVYIRFGEADNTLTRTAVDKTDSIQYVREKVMDVSKEQGTQPQGIYMTPEELESLLNSMVTAQQPGLTNTNVTQTTDSTGVTLSQVNQVTPELQNEFNELKIQNKVMELQLQEMEARQKETIALYDERLKAQREELEREYENDKLKEELRDANREVRNMNRQQMEDPKITNPTPENYFEEGQDTSTKVLNYLNSSAMAFIGFGDANGFGIGFRTHYKIKNSKYDLVPQVYYGLIGDKLYGFDLNVQTDIKMKKLSDKFKPYVGLGLGLTGVEESSNSIDNKASFNIILGTGYEASFGKLYFDYTIRNFFNVNQLSAGYIFNF